MEASYQSQLVRELRQAQAEVERLRALLRDTLALWVPEDDSWRRKIERALDSGPGSANTAEDEVELISMRLKRAQGERDEALVKVELLQKQIEALNDQLQRARRDIRHLIRKPS